MMPVYYDPVYTDGIDPEARFPRERYRMVAETLADDPLIEMPRPRAATREELCLAHDAAYVDAFLTQTLDPAAIRKIGLRPWTPSIVERTLRLTGGSLDALDHAMHTGGYAANMAGGTHHAFRARGGGYCIFNDIAVAAYVALARGIERVCVVDLDVHQGDGTASILEHEPRVFTLSVHCEANFPFQKETSDLDVGLPADLGDDAYLEAVGRALDAALSPAPGLVLYQAGVDGLGADRLGRLDLTRGGMARRNELVFDAVDALGVPTVVFMGGGYCKPLTPTIDAFSDLFREAARRHAHRVRG